MDHSCYFCLVLLCLNVLLFVDALWSPAGKGLRCPIVTLSGVVLDCTDS